MDGAFEDGVVGHGGLVVRSFESGRETIVLRSFPSWQRAGLSYLRMFCLVLRSIIVL